MTRKATKMRRYAFFLSIGGASSSGLCAMDIEPSIPSKDVLNDERG